MQKQLGKTTKWESSDLF